MTDPITRLIFELTKLPGIGEKTAMRLAYFILKMNTEEVRSLATSLTIAKEKIRLCDECFTFTDASPCSICCDARRKTEMLCVVEKPSDIRAIENSQRFFGLYHVLHGILSPLDGIGPDQLRIKELLLRLQKRNVSEVILAMNPSVEGEATVVYLTKLLCPLGIRVTKLAHGIPMGGVLEYIDRQTIGRAIENRMSCNV